MLRNMFNNDVADVKHFGAKGDGRTDDSAAIQHALDTGRDILISNGVFIIKTAIHTVKDNQKIIGNGLIKIENTSLTWSMIKLKNNGCVIDGPGIDNKFAQGAVHISGNNCTVQNCSFIESGYRGYHIFVNSDCEHTTIKYNKFTGGNTNEPMVFISHAKDIKVLQNHFKDSGSWAIHTDYVEKIMISENICENSKFDHIISSQDGQKIFTYDTNNMFAFPTFGIVILSGSQVLKSGFTKTSKQGNITITFEKGRKYNEKIRCLAFKGAENFNINSRTHNCNISNNHLYNSGDSNITIASDYREKKLDPKNTKREDYPSTITIQNNFIENALGCNIAVSHTDNVKILDNTCINAGYGHLSTFYNSSIAVPQGIECSIEGNNIRNINGGMAAAGILALENSLETKKYLRKNSFTNIPVPYYLGAESDYHDFKSGVYIEGIYKQFGDIQKNINAVWKSRSLPFDSEYFSFDQYMNIASKEKTSTSDKNFNVVINNKADGYFDINLKKESLLNNSLVRFYFNAATRKSNGRGLIQVLYKWSNNYQVKNIPILGSTLKNYEIFIPFSNPQDVIFRLVAKKANDTFYIQNIEISYLQL